MTSLHLISAGAAQGLFMHLQDEFQTSQACRVESTFGAVGMMKDRLLGGAPCDVLILTQVLVDQLMADGQLVTDTGRPLGRVKTGVAVKQGELAPDVSTPAALKAALQASAGIYFPDPVKSTAGIHFMSVLQKLGLQDELADRLRPFPNGATAMKVMADTPGQGLIGCTQVTEILYTPGITLIANLPVEFELATLYAAAICSRAGNPELAAQLVHALSDAQNSSARRSCGFDT